MKACIKCKKSLPRTDEWFYKKKTSEDGLDNTCKECKREYNKNYWKKNKETLSEKKKQHYEENREIYAERNKQYREENKETLLEYNRNYYKENREQILEQKKEYYERTREEKLAYREVYYQENKEELIQYARKYYRDNKDKIRKYNKKYRNENRELRNTLEHKRRAIKKRLPATLSLAQWEVAKKSFSGRCAYCGEKAELTRDHFVPVVSGGGFTKDNIIPACLGCNCSKQDKCFFEWYPEQEFYSKERERAILKYLGYKNGKQQMTLALEVG